MSSDSKKAKIYITDEGFGPIVRQSAIIEELKKQNGNLQVNMQLDRHYEEAQHIIPGISYTRKFNNIVWHKQRDGTPDAEAIRNYYADYESMSDLYIADQKMMPEQRPDFIISDFVYEAFDLAEHFKIPSFGVSHFTWDWFFSKMYPSPLRSSLLRRFMDQAAKAKFLFFPPFTPREIIQHYKERVVEVPFIVRKRELNRFETQNGKPNILVMDSGSAVNHLAMEKIAKALPGLTDYHFYLPGTMQVHAENITNLPKNKLLVDYIGSMDLVISRAGFNTITECIAYRTPMLLFGEALNAEMRENNFFVKEQGLGSFTSLELLKNNPARVIGDFFDGEYAVLKRNMEQHEIRVNGAEVVANKILEAVN